MSHAAYRCRSCGCENHFRIEPLEYEGKTNVKPLELEPGQGGHFRLLVCAGCGLTEWFAVAPPVPTRRAPRGTMTFHPASAHHHHSRFRNKH